MNKTVILTAAAATMAVSVAMANANPSTLQLPTALAQHGLLQTLVACAGDSNGCCAGDPNACCAGDTDGCCAGAGCCGGDD